MSSMAISIEGLIIAIVAIGVAIYFTYRFGKGAWKCIKRLWSCIQCDVHINPPSRPSRRPIQRRTPSPQQSRGSSAAPTGNIAILDVETLEHIIQPRQREVRSLPHPPPDYPSASTKAPTRSSLYALPGHGYDITSATMPCIPTCVICQDSVCDCCLDCGHLFCTSCVGEVEERDSICPICRKLFTDVRKIYSDNSLTNNGTGASQKQRPTCVTGICPGLDCDSCLTCGHMLCYVCACQLEEMDSKCHVCHKPFTDIRRIYY